MKRPPRAKDTDSDRRDMRRWHLDKRLNVGHLLTTLTIAGALFFWASKVDTRIALLEQTIGAWQSAQDKRDNLQDDQLVRLADNTLDHVRAINEKIDRLIEREVARGRR